MKTRALNTVRQNYFRDIYKKRGVSVDWNFGTTSHKLIELIIDGTIKRGSKILDIGSGPGTESIFLAKQGMKVTGIDINSDAISFAQKMANFQNEQIDFITGDALKLPFKDNTFDVVNDTFVFHHFEPKIRNIYASEVKRVLKKNGLFILRGFSYKMTSGSGPFRLTSTDILSAFLPFLNLDHLSLFKNLPTVKRPDQWHWFGIFRNN